MPQAWLLACLLIGSLGAAVVPTAASAPADPLADEVRAPRREGVMVRVLRAPARALDLMVRPIGGLVTWAERVNLPERVNDALYFNEERTAGWTPIFDVGGSSGAGGGVGVFHRSLWGQGEEIELTAFVADEQRRATLSFVDPAVGTRPVTVLAQVRYTDDEDDDLFIRRGPGRMVSLGRRASDETTYAIEIVRGQVDAGIGVRPNLTLGVTFQPTYAVVDEGKGSEPPIPRTIDGFGGPQVLVGGGPYVEWDARDARARPRRGWYLRAEGGYWSGLRGETTPGDPYRYARYRVDLRRYQPTPLVNRSFVLRVMLDRVESDDGAVPFWALPVLDEDTFLRGFERNRFRDRGALLVNVEYRYPIWDTWDAFLFVDEGQVFREYAAVGIRRFEWSAGAGILFATRSGFLFQVRYAASAEDQRIAISLQPSI